MILSNGAKSALAGLLALALVLTPVMAMVPVARAEPYEVVSALDNLPASRALAAAAVVDDNLYVIGGALVVNPDIGSVQDSVIIYDISTGDATYGTPMPTGVAAAAYGLGTDGKIYVAGGWTGSTYNSQVQIYDPASDTWAVATNPTPTSIGRCASTMGLDGRLYVFGSGWYTNITLAYTPTTDSWEYKTDLLVDSHDASAVVVNATGILLIGGNSGPTNRVWWYNPVADDFTELNQMNLAKRGAGAAVGKGGHVYSIGGTSSSSIYGSPQYYEIERYDAASDEWTIVSSYWLNWQVSNFATAVDSYGRIFVVGGQSGASIVSYVQMITTMEVSESRGIQITSPAGGTYVHGLVTITATMINSYGGYFLSVDLYVDGGFRESQYGGQVVSFMWDTAGLTDDSNHVLMVRAFDWEGKVLEDSVTVTVSALTVEQKIAALEDEIETLQAQLAAANGNLTTILATLAELDATLSDLQSQLDDTQEQMDQVESKSDDANMYAIINLVLVIVVIVLLALMFVMSRRKP